MTLVGFLIVSALAFVFGLKFIQVSKERAKERAALSGMARDVEDKTRGAETQNRRLEAVFNSMVEGVIVTDKAGRIVSINPAIERIFNISKDDVEGKFFLEAIRNKEIYEVIESVLKNRASASGEINLILPVRKVFQFNAAPLYDDGRINGSLVVAHDITETRRLETMRRDFVANVSHELKTPLTSIKGFVETLLEGALDDKENNRQFLKIIQDHTARLDSLVSDLLSLSHLESRETALDMEKFELKGQADEVIAGFRSQLKKNNIEIKNNLSSGLKIMADKAGMGQVLTNLIDNAIKFNKESGNIRISGDGLNGRIKIVVEDSGIGIPEKDSLRIFERFYRVDKARSRELGGTGLGLSIVKHIIELHGGSVGVESTEGLGSKFWFTLPI